MTCTNEFSFSHQLSEAMQKLKKVYIIIAVMGLCIGCDQVSKNLAEQNLKSSSPRSYFGNVFRLQYAENTGAFLSIGSGLPEFARTWLFTILSGTLLILLFVYILVNRHFARKHVFALSLILGGGTGNLIDRILNDGRVVDFMNMGIGRLRTGIFNIADVVIMTGMALILLYSFLDRARAKSQEGSEVDEAH